VTTILADVVPEHAAFVRAARLKTWKATLQSTVEDTMPAFLRLEDESRNLQVVTTEACPL